MKKQLRLEIKQNLRRPPRVYVKSADLTTIYGSFTVDTPQSFDGWGKLSLQETIELKQFMQNTTAVYRHLKPSYHNSLADFRFRLPMDFIETLESLEILCHEEGVDMNIFDALIPTLIQQMKIAVSKLTNEAKTKGLLLLDKAHIAEFKKQDHSEAIQAVFAELQAVPNRSEKLHHYAVKLFNKDKSYSPRAIQGMASGETLPSKWLAACAIEVLLDERKETLGAMLSTDDLFMLWAKPLSTSNYSEEELILRAKLFDDPDLIKRLSAIK